MNQTKIIKDLYDLQVSKLGKYEALTYFIENMFKKELDYKTKLLATREDLERGFKEQSRWMLGTFITLTLMILGLYAAILLR
ncbi:MAG: hypothetical protein EAZ15_06355 [Sphingobacteriales bacterium]|nr:MAG: hypothetical protein EAZ15_06355 [Sphingobacteriales bacterium]